ncbi:hypothetical protein [Paenibacillus xylanexedens]|uniref:Uncharacterized membrane protein YhaH (DUF805 family) n=1 Tax=Paenibacillus xylanexedens TaxID=528191 RepID=A0ABS4RPN3_PAEXY|nr:hypothetical protein [Paenibacillus xylanexedens]MBP2244259.1 uncharacterized membrane protein YhaH (DUF805 family) [Paenibacillus xylanexedens]
MEEILKEISKIAGIPSVIFTVIFIIMRIKPITLITSNPVEIKMLSKEKRFSIKIVKYLFEIFIILSLMLLMTFSVFTKKSMFNPIIGSIWAVLLLIIFIFMLAMIEVKNKRLNDILRPMPKVLSVVIFIISLILSASFYVLPTYYVGTQLSSILNEIEKPTTSILLFVLGLNSIMYLIIIIFILMPVGRLISRFFDFDNALSNLNNKYVFIEIEEDGENKRWYLNYPIDAKWYYLTDSVNFSVETNSRFIEIEELYKKILKIETT